MTTKTILKKTVWILFLLAILSGCNSEAIKAKVETFAVATGTTLIAGPVAGITAGTIDYIAHIALESSKSLEAIKTPEQALAHVATDIGTKIIIAWILFELIKLFLMPKYIKSVQRKNIKRENRDILK